MVHKDVVKYIPANRTQKDNPFGNVDVTSIEVSWDNHPIEYQREQIHCHKDRRDRV